MLAHLYQLAPLIAPSLHHSTHRCSHLLNQTANLFFFTPSILFDWRIDCIVASRMHITGSGEWHLMGMPPPRCFTAQTLLLCMPQQFVFDISEWKNALE